MQTCPSCHAQSPGSSRFCGSCGSTLSNVTPTSAATFTPGDAAPPPSQPAASRRSISPTGAPTVLLTARSAAGGVGGGGGVGGVGGERLFTPGTVVASRYRIVACLGQGGMGEVYRADDLTLGQPVALKFLPPGLAENPRWMERFRNEVRVARQVAHPNVCRVHDLGDVPAPAGAQGGQSLQFLTMEYIDGEDLASLLRRIGRLPRDKAVQVAHQLCAGLAAAHTAGVLHRDLKPANIMIDGRGNSKITDFGIAGIAGSIEGHDVRSGTPAYMSPEQLAGREVTVRSDVYSLGLVLYELFTGRRAFADEAAPAPSQSRTATELSRPSTIVDDMDPAIERVIMRCLSDDPMQRPPGALSVAAGLPGGDPLRAALEAGETPSPELVAAAGSDARASKRLTMPLLAASILAIVACFVVSRWTGLASFLPLPRSPEVLADRAREVVAKLGPQLVVKDDASRLALKRGQLEALGASTAPDRWTSLKHGRPAVLRFWYRTSPQRLAPLAMGGVVQEHDPALEVPGMVLVELDSMGRLTVYQAVPPWTPDAVATAAHEPGPGIELAAKAESKALASSPAPAPADWSAAFALAELSPTDFKPADPNRVPAHFADERFAWDAVSATGPAAGLRIEAASYEGRPTMFRVMSAIDQRDAPARAGLSPAQYYQYVVQSLIITGILFSIWLARLNYRTGRGDRSGAARLASGFFSLSMITWALSSHWMGEMMSQWLAFLQGVARGLLLGGLAWVFYLALEPFVRRRSPQLIVSWTRLVSGRVRDPLVGRDALIGILLGAAFALLSKGLPLVHQQITGVLPMPALFDPQVLSGVLGGVTTIVNSIVTASINAMLIFFVFIALDSFIPRRLGMVLFGLLVAGAFVADTGGTSTAVAIAYAVVVGVVFTLCLARVGLFTFVVAIAVASVLLAAPLTTDFGAWHARGMWVILLALAALISWAFTSAVGIGHPRRAAPSPAR